MHHCINICNMIFISAEFEKIETDKPDCWHAIGASDGLNRLRRYGSTGITVLDCKKFCAALDGCIGFNIKYSRIAFLRKILSNS